MISLPPETEALIDRLQRVAFGYFETYANPENGLIADSSTHGAPCSIAATGFGLAALPVGVERSWISRQAALQQALATARFFHSAQQSTAFDGISHRGFFYHFLDMQTGQRAWNCEISSIDTAILCFGLLTAAAYFDGDGVDERELRDRADEIVATIEWSWLVDRAGLLRMGWKPEYGFLKPRWTGYSEALLILALGLGAPRHRLHPEIYDKWRAGFAWLGDATSGYVAAGPLFIHLFGHAWLDLTGAPTGLPPSGSEINGIDYVENSRRAIAAQRAYAAANPGGFDGYSDEIWGLSACPGIGRRCTLHDGRRISVGAYVARGVPYGPDDGTLAPWAALACLPLTPTEAISGFHAVLSQYPHVLEHGRFIDAFNPSIRGRHGDGWVSPRSTGLDQGLIVAMVENARSGLIHRLTAKSSIIACGLAAIRKQG